MDSPYYIDRIPLLSALAALYQEAQAAGRLEAARALVVVGQHVGRLGSDSRYYVRKSALRSLLYALTEVCSHPDYLAGLGLAAQVAQIEALELPPPQPESRARADCPTITTCYALCAMSGYIPHCPSCTPREDNHG